MAASRTRSFTAILLATALYLPGAIAQAAAPPEMKAAASEGVKSRAKLAQEMVDSIYSFAEPGFQEFRTSEYVTKILEENGFKIERGVAGIPTAWTATWGSGGPKIGLGSDIDALLALSQTPGSPELKPQVQGAPGHGEGHNSGMPMMVVAALAAKDIMQANNLPGTLMIWPGVAEELLATKAFYVREGLFDDVDVNIFSHVSRDFSTGWGPAGNNGMVSVEYTFHGKTSHAAGAPWAGRSALDGVELMNTAWNMRREHLPVTQRSHYVITNGGGQPNIVPGEASVWYYFREQNFETIRGLYEIGNRISEAAAMATDTRVERRVLGYAAPNYGNKPLAEAAYANIRAVGMPQWSEADQAFARATQEANHLKVEPLATEIAELSTPDSRGISMGGGSDDIGDIMWTVPTITIRYPSNIPNTIGHHVTAAIAMATPIAHKGVVVGAEAVAMTILDLVTTPSLVAEAKDYFQNVQLKDQKYDPVLADTDMPGIHLNEDIMARMRPKMEPFYYDPSKYDTYLEQLGIAYPNLPAKK
ncbi:MAG: amidohydrolase [Phenylobacterium sp.]|uniref:amidohydrolase n=1 Tax=Phenylobacterium sp. TaxID=1871053 RepID=UPI002735C354|nr:amidohydrolase [Phenylobacterium sp.]MDP1641726.1 amidohydrolase [Phenylobacterium sp.]MDP3118394.1 amidohydrolase [Phenylobacterium sp.]MDP3384021.1 amidohydrolase [Phenylobacterium sp.]